MFPWKNETEEISDFKWDTLPVTYSVRNFIERQKFNLNAAEKMFEKFAGNNLLEFKDDESAQINFYCQDITRLEDILLNWETNFWTTGNYFPAAQPEYFFDNDKVKEVKITLFGQERVCGGIELHELLHGLGLRNHYGPWMWYEREVCKEDGSIDKDSINALKELYELK